MKEVEAIIEVPQRLAAITEKYQEFQEFIERRTGDRALAQEILQDAFLRSLDKLSDIERDESVVAWFYRVLRNAVIDHARKRASEQRRLSALADELAALDENRAPSSDAGQAVCRCVMGLAESLKPEYAEAVRRIDLEGESLGEFAAGLGITPNNAAVRAFRARDALRKRVREACGACAEQGCSDCSCGPGT
jgi:RNA polymerase sigma factor (sigma-70 family)